MHLTRKSLFQPLWWSSKKFGLTFPTLPDWLIHSILLGVNVQSIARLLPGLGIQYIDMARLSPCGTDLG